MKQIKNKKGLSVIIGFVLLIVFGAVMGVIIYKWQKTFVPQEEYADCPEAASLFIINKSYDCDTDTLTFAIKNNGQFAIGAYFIYVKDNESKTIATKDISINNTDQLSRLYDFYKINAVKLGRETPIPYQNNSFESGEIEIEQFYLPNIEDKVFGFDIVPIRWQNESKRKIIASCKDERISEEVDGCAAPLCVDNGLACLGRTCGIVLNNCYEEIQCPPGCGIGQFCNSTGKCVTPIDCTLNCDDLGYVCGTWEICGTSVTCGTMGGDCNDGFTCNGGSCVVETSTCDGVWDPTPGAENVECDNPLDINCDNCNCINGYVGDGDGGCEISGGGIPESCPAVCQDLGYTGTPVGSCRQNPSQCTPGVHESSGDVWCNIGNADTCCCY